MANDRMLAAGCAFKFSVNAFSEVALCFVPRSVAECPLLHIGPLQPQQAIVESIQMHRRHGDLCILLHLVRGMLNASSILLRRRHDDRKFVFHLVGGVLEGRPILLHRRHDDRLVIFHLDRGVIEASPVCRTAVMTIASLVLVSLGASSSAADPSFYTAATTMSRPFAPMTERAQMLQLHPPYEPGPTYH
jgi:hypothetical protein